MEYPDYRKLKAEIKAKNKAYKKSKPIAEQEWPEYEPNINNVFSWAISPIGGVALKIDIKTGEILNVLEDGVRFNDNKKVPGGSVESGRSGLGELRQSALWEVPTMQKKESGSVVIQTNSRGETLFYCLLCNSYI